VEFAQNLVAGMQPSSTYAFSPPERPRPEATIREYLAITKMTASDRQRRSRGGVTGEE
jgi:hypothetical protein